MSQTENLTAEQESLLTNDRGVTHLGEMSSFLYYYHDWLNGKKDSLKDWESKLKSR